MRTGWLLLLALAWPALAKRSFAKNVDERDFWLGIGIGGGLGLLGLLAAVFCTCLAERWEEVRRATAAGASAVHLLAQRA